MTSSWFFLSTPNYDARSTTHQIYVINKFSTHFNLRIVNWLADCTEASGLRSLDGLICRLQMIDLEKLLTISKRLRWSLLECVGQTLLCVDSMRCVAFCSTTPLGLIHDICYLSQLTTLLRYGEPWRASGTVQFGCRSMGRVGYGEGWLSRNLRWRVTTV